MKNNINVEINYEKSKRYNILIEEGLIKKASVWLPEKDKKLVIITDDIVKDLYGLSLEESLKQAGYDPLLLSFPAGERYKNIDTKCAVETQMLEQKCGRDTIILALGGGVVGDLAGFIAATYMRGIPYIQIPTTLLAMLDSSIGGKTAMDTPQGKNLIGAFWQPDAVISDISVLQTLSQEQLINGLMEAVKIFLTSDVDSVKFLQKNQEAIMHRDPDILTELVKRAAQLKVNIMSRDVHEHHERMVLNFGHTIGHALELLSDYQLLHGYAVALGILVEAKIACLSGLLSGENLLEIEKILQSFGIHRGLMQAFDVEKIIKATHLDKKKKGQKIRYVLLKQPGVVQTEGDTWVFEVEDEVVRQAFS